MPVAKRRSKPAKVEEPEELEELEELEDELEEDSDLEDLEEEEVDEDEESDEEEDDDLAELEEPEELDEEEEEQPKPKKARAKKKATAPKKPKVQGHNIAWLVDLVNTQTDKTTAPPQVRGWLRSLVKKGVVQHGEKDRWVFSGVEDPAVVALLDAIKGGKFEQTERKGNPDALAKARAKRAENLAKKREAQAAAEELDDDEADEVEEEAPKPKRRTRKAAKK